MARDYPGGNTDTDKVVVGQYAAINNLSAFTLNLHSWRDGNGGNSAGAMMLKDNGFYTHTTTTVYRFQALRWSGAQGLWSIARPSGIFWHSIIWAYSYSSTTNDPTAYVDGEQVVVTEVTTPTGTATLDDSGNDLIIGNNSDVRCWDGRLEQAIIWNRIITADEARYIHAVRADTPQDDDSLFSGVVLYVPMDANTSPEPNDATGQSAHTGTVTGTSYIGGASFFTPDTGGSGAFPGLGGMIVR